MIRNREQENLNLNHRLCWIILMTHLMLLKCKLKPWGGATVIQNSNTLEESCLQLSALDWLWYCKTIHFNLSRAFSISQNQDRAEENWLLSHRRPHLPHLATSSSIRHGRAGKKVRAFDDLFFIIDGKNAFMKGSGAMRCAGRRALMEKTAQFLAVFFRWVLKVLAHFKLKKTYSRKRKRGILLKRGKEEKKSRASLFQNKMRIRRIAQNTGFKSF